jgi:squalene synthase HpnC
VITRVGIRPHHAAIEQPPQPFELEACYRYCEALASARHHNFPVASLFVPTALRKHIWAIYAFARAADDFADESAYEGRRAAELDEWERRLQSCYYGEPSEHPIFHALADTIRRFELPITEFSALIQGFRADLETTSYSTYGDLASYTALAAQPVGHLILYLGGYTDPVLHRYADDLATGLAIAKVLQDIPADFERGRVYLPGEDLRHFGVTDEDLRQRRRSPAVAALGRYEVARVRALFERARPLVDLIGDNLAIEMALMWLGGMRILGKIERSGDRLLCDRARLTSVDKAAVVSRALAWRGSALRTRGKRFLGG